MCVTFKCQCCCFFLSCDISAGKIMACVNCNHNPNYLRFSNISCLSCGSWFCFECAAGIQQNNGNNQFVCTVCATGINRFQWNIICGDMHRSFCIEIERMEELSEDRSFPNAARLGYRNIAVELRNKLNQLHPHFGLEQ